MFLQILTVAGLATFFMYAAIPTGFVLGLSAWVIFLASVAGGLAGVFITAFLGERIRCFFTKNKTPDRSKSKSRMAHRIWNKYGIIGLGLLGTFTIGAPVSLAVGIGFKAPLHQLVIWCCIGVVTRCTVFTLISYCGFQLF